MVLIISDEYDLSTNLVIDYLKYNRVNFVRINDIDRVMIKNITISNGAINYQLIVSTSEGLMEIDSDKIESYWYRRGWFCPFKKWFNLA